MHVDTVRYGIVVILTSVFMCVMVQTNLNHERWFVSAMANRHARTALEEALRYTQKRKTMGQTLIEHQAIRTKIAKMTMAVESSHQMVEHMTFQMIHMDEEEQRIMLAGMSALLKVQTCQTFEMCTREASQCMGGISYVRSGQGRKLVRLANVHISQRQLVPASR